MSAQFPNHRALSPQQRWAAVAAAAVVVLAVAGLLSDRGFRSGLMGMGTVLDGLGSTGRFSDKAPAWARAERQQSQGPVPILEGEDETGAAAPVLQEPLSMPEEFQAGRLSGAKRLRSLEFDDAEKGGTSSPEWESALPASVEEPSEKKDQAAPSRTDSSSISDRFRHPSPPSSPTPQLQVAADTEGKATRDAVLEQAQRKPLSSPEERTKNESVDLHRDPSEEIPSPGWTDSDSYRSPDLGEIDAVGNRQRPAGTAAAMARNAARRLDAPSRETRLGREDVTTETSTGAAAGEGFAAPARPAAGGKTDSGLLSVAEDALSGPEAVARRAARRFLSDNAALEGLSFQSPDGYWQNTYLPGDPEIRLLQGRLARWWPGGPRPERAARPNLQPFDPPANAALALTLQADRAAIRGPARLRLQVGLQGIPRRGGHRPAMNVALVLDLRELAESDDGAPARALTTALERSRQSGDRFFLIAAGRPGGLLVTPEEFRHGPIQLALAGLFGAGEQPEDGTRSPALDLTQALALAQDRVAENDDPGNALETRLVLLATGASLTAELPALERLTHRGAVRGIPLSVAVLGGGAELDQVDRLVRAGQGNRRILRGPEEAQALVAGELDAASRAIARAVRLRILLAPGVKLVRVLGSERLDRVRTERVRQAERSIDRRLARHLGIRADRGEDEEGIQVLIPAFYAGDSHFLLLDLVAERAGFIADARIRYKDLAYLRNGVARTRLNIPEGESAPGPLQLSVLGNRLALELAQAARQASVALGEGDRAAAEALLTGARDLLRGMRHEVPGWTSAPGLLADEGMLNDYLAMLRAAPAGDEGRRRYLAASLRVAAFRRTLPERAGSPGPNDLRIQP